MEIWEFLKGRKTYIIGCLLIALGFMEGSVERVLEGLVVMSLRNGLTTELAKTLIKKKK